MFQMLQMANSITSELELDQYVEPAECEENALSTGANGEVSMSLWSWRTLVACHYISSV
jgi:hypothetical protein